MPLFAMFVASCASLPQGPEIMDNSVRFSLYAPQARSVSIAGTFNQWDPHRDQLKIHGRPGLWSIQMPLASGRYEYLFVIDAEQWVPDQGAPGIDDGMGGITSVIVMP
jgi:1,4-alpha-glucan branching enzyme